MVDYKTGQLTRRVVRGQGAVPDEVLRPGRLAHARRHPPDAAADLPRQRRDAALRARRARPARHRAQGEALWEAIQRARTRRLPAEPSACATGATHQAICPAWGGTPPPMPPREQPEEPSEPAGRACRDQMRGFDGRRGARCSTTGLPSTAGRRPRRRRRAAARVLAVVEPHAHAPASVLDGVHAAPEARVRVLAAYVLSRSTAVGRLVHRRPELGVHRRASSSSSRSPIWLRSRRILGDAGLESSAPPGWRPGRATPSRTCRTPPGSGGGTRSPAAAPPRPGSRPEQVTRHRALGVGVRDRREQRLRVRVLGVGEDLLGRPDLDDPAEVHDRDPVAEELRAGQVVGDVDVGEVELLLEVEHQLQDLGPHATCRASRSARRPPARSGPMMIARAITTRCFCPPDRSRGYLSGTARPARGPTRSRASMTLARRSLGRLHAVDAERVADASRSVMAGFSAALGSWKTICTSRADLPQPRRHIVGDVLALEADRPVGRGSETQQRAAQRRLAAAALADQPDDLALVQRQVDAVDRLDGARVATEQPRERASAQVEVHREVLMSMTSRLRWPRGRRRGQASSATVSSSCSSGCVPPSGIWSSRAGQPALDPAAARGRCRPGSWSAQTFMASGTGDGSGSRPAGRPGRAARRG